MVVIAFFDEVDRRFERYVTNDLASVSCDFRYRKISVRNRIFKLGERITHNEKYGDDE